MKKLQEAIQEITYRTNKFPEEAFQIIVENAEEAKPYLYKAISNAIDKLYDLEVEYQLHFYALFFLGEFKDQSAFKLIMKMISQPYEMVEYQLGGVATEGLKDVLYLTYDGDLELLKTSIWNTDIDDFVRSAMLDVMGQLYFDHELDEEEWKSLLKALVYYDGDIGEYIYTALIGIICRCHLVDLLPELRFLFQKDIIDVSVYGEYDSCVDEMFLYWTGEDRLCEASINASDCLRRWALFDQEEYHRDELDFDFDKIIKKFKLQENKTIRKQKIGRNDPCPCGSNKKYKHCCLNKPKNDEILIESESEQQKWLKYYPKIENQKQDGRVYIDDFFDKESIEIDKLVYLALKYRPTFIWESEDENTINNRTKAYLWEAFSKYLEKTKIEGIKTYAEYDEKYSIHYMCYEWMSRLEDLLKGSEDKDKYNKVASVLKEYS